MRERFLEIFTFGEYNFWSDNWKYDIPMYICRWIVDFCLLFLVIYLISFFVYHIIRYINKDSKICKINKEIVFSQVIKKEYTMPYSEIIFVGRIPITRQTLPHYRVYVKYDEVEEVFDDEELFNQVNEEDQISTCLKTGLNKKGKVVKQYIELAPLN